MAQTGELYQISIKDYELALRDASLTQRVSEFYEQQESINNELFSYLNTLNNEHTILLNDVTNNQIELSYKIDALQEDLDQYEYVAASALNDLHANIPSNVSDLTNDAGYLTEHQDISGKADDSSVVHNTGNELISGAKTLIAGGQLKLQDSWNQIYNEDDDETLGSVLNGKLSITGTAKKAASIPYGVVDSTSTGTAFTATVPGITELVDGTCVVLKNGVVTSAAGFTIDINGLGAHHVFSSMTPATDIETVFNVNYTMMFIYRPDVTMSGVQGAWMCYYGYNSNTNTIGYQLRTNSSTKPMKDITYRYRLLFTSADGLGWVPATTSTSTNATTKRDVNQTPIDPFGEIVYYNKTAVVAVGEKPTEAYLWQQYPFALGYSFNSTGAALALTVDTPVYVKCAPQSDGSVIIDADTPYVQALPTTEDGKIYIYLGMAVAATTVEMTMKHPVYYFRGGAIRAWTNESVDAIPTPNSKNAVSSEGVHNELGKCLKTSEYQGGVIARSGETLSTGIIVGNSSGYANAAANVTFDQSYSILYYNDGISYDSHSNVAQTGALGTGEMWYLKCGKNGVNLTINSITSTVPSNADNFVYIPLGNSKTSGTIEFKSCNQLFAYSDGKFKECSELIMNLDYRESTGNSITLYEGEIVDCGTISNPEFDLIVGGNDIGEYRAFFTCGLTGMSLTFNDVVINWKEIPQMTFDSVYEINILRANNKFYGVMVKYE